MAPSLATVLQSASIVNVPKNMAMVTMHFPPLAHFINSTIHMLTTQMIHPMRREL
jgi:hypothetical protein